MRGGELDTLVALVEQGPLWDGDLPSKTGRDCLIELAETWEVAAEFKGGGDDAARTRRETLRECADALRMLADANVAPAPPTEREKRMEALLTSAAAIAGRRGVDVAWDRFAASIRDEGIGAITARTYRVLPSDRET